MISGARQARPSWLRRLVGRAMARQLTAFVVPGPEVARARGLDVEAAGLPVVDTPRHASVLLVVGELPAGLKSAAAVAYAQMPRPRAVLAVGAGDLSPLPEADVPVDLDQRALASGVADLRRAFTRGAFDLRAQDFTAEEVKPQEDEGHEGMHHHGHGSGEESESEEDAEEDDIGGPVPGEDFMSMVEMTEGTPRSGDGLQMEWVQAPFGPLFPGLPGGLELALTLDGDTVAQAEAGSRIKDPGYPLSGPVEDFVGHVAGLDPLSPVAYRVLALRAIEDAAGIEVDERLARRRTGALERERAASHLNWLAGFGHIIGDGWLSRRAAELQLALLRAAGVEEAERTYVAVEEFIRRAGRTLLLENKLGGVGSLRRVDLTGASGPVARAGGLPTDARSDEPAYRDLGFSPVFFEDNDALSRLRVRLTEIEQSLKLVREAGAISAGEPIRTAPSGMGTATVETPRGEATLRVVLEEGVVRSAKLDTPSAGHLGLVGTLMGGRELADALVGVASLDISPWGAS